MIAQLNFLQDKIYCSIANEFIIKRKEKENLRHCIYHIK